MTINKPKVFVGSSTESLKIAYAIQTNLDDDAEVTVWKQGVFQLSNTNIESLVQALNEFDFAVFILSPDDLIKIRDKDQQGPRDNVIFELGLFVGGLGRQRTFIAKPKGESKLHLPTDLLGLIAGEYNAHRQDNNLLAALAPICSQLRDAIEKLGVRETRVGGTLKTAGQTIDATHMEEEYDKDDAVILVADYLEKNLEHFKPTVFKFAEIDQTLGLITGTTGQVMEEAARHAKVDVLNRSSKLVTLYKIQNLFA